MSRSCFFHILLIVRVFLETCTSTPSPEAASYPICRLEIDPDPGYFKGKCEFFLKFRLDFFSFRVT